MKTPVLTVLIGALLVGGSVSAQVETEATPVEAKSQEKKQRRKKQRMQKLEIGKTIPADVSLPTIDGKTRTFGDLRGKVVFVHFWSIKCPWEKYAEPVILDLEKKFEGKPVAVLAINSNQNEIGAKPMTKKEGEHSEKDAHDKKGDEHGKKGEHSEKDAHDKKGEHGEHGQKTVPYANLVNHVKKTKGFNHEVMVDHGNVVSRLFGARTTPHCYVIDQKGVLRYAGALDGYAQDRQNPEPFVKNAIDALLAGKEVTVTSSKPYG